MRGVAMLNAMRSNKIKKLSQLFYSKKKQKKRVNGLA